VADGGPVAGEAGERRAVSTLICRTPVSHRIGIATAVTAEPKELIAAANQ
jgi:hypothetical protein